MGLKLFRNLFGQIIFNQPLPTVTPSGREAACNELFAKLSVINPS
jgi:hypothetical protein